MKADNYVIHEIKEKIIELYDYVWETGYNCEDCEYKKLIHEPHGEVTRHCAMEHYIDECPVVELAIEENRIGGSKQ